MKLTVKKMTKLKCLYHLGLVPSDVTVFTSFRCQLQNQAIKNQNAKAANIDLKINVGANFIITFNLNYLKYYQTAFIRS